MDDYMKKHWWLFLLRSLGLLALGIFTLVWPDLDVRDLATAIALYLLLSGVVDIIVGVRDDNERRLWFFPLALGIAEVAAGIYLLRQPEDMTIESLATTAGAAFIAQGILTAVEAYSEVAHNNLKRLLIIGGVLAAVVGFILIGYSDAEMVDEMLWLLGGFGIIGGALGIATSLKNNTLDDDVASTDIK